MVNLTSEKHYVGGEVSKVVDEAADGVPWDDLPDGRDDVFYVVQIQPTSAQAEFRKRKRE